MKFGIRKHIAVHLPNPTFMCLECKYESVSKTALKLHIKANHEGELENEINACTRCFKQFSTNKEAKEHMKRHEKRSSVRK